MRGTKAKKIRRSVYGDASLRVERKYVAQKIGIEPNESYVYSSRVNHPDSLRAKYQLAKRR